MMKKLAITALLTLAVSASASAEVQRMEMKGSNYNFVYPHLIMNNDKATARANKQIKTELKKANKKVKQGTYVTVNTDYEVVLENDKLMNILFVNSEYAGGAHGMYYTDGLVFNKDNGRLLQYTAFVPEISTEDLKYKIMTKQYKVFCRDRTTPSTAPFLKDWDGFDVSESYMLGEDGYVYLIYQPYDLDSYAAGTTYVQYKTYDLENVNYKKTFDGNFRIASN